MMKISTRSLMLGGAFGCGFMLLAQAVLADPPTDLALKDKPQQTGQTKPAVNGQAVKPGQGVTMNGVGTNTSTASPTNPGGGSAWGGQSNSVTTPTGTQTFGTSNTVTTPGGGKQTFGGAGWGATGSVGLPGSGTSTAAFGSNGVAHASQGGMGAGLNGTGSAGPHLNNGGTAGVSDDANSDNKGVVDTLVDGVKSAWNATLGASGTPATEVNKALNGGDSGGTDGGSKQGGHRTIPIYTPPGKKDGGSSADDRETYGAGGRSASNGSTINLGNKGGGDSGGKGGGGGQTDQGGTSGAGGKSAANGATVNLGAKAGGDAPLKKPTDKGVLDSSKVTNGAVDPKLGNGPGG